MKFLLAKAPKPPSWSARIGRPWDSGLRAFRRLTCSGHNESQEDLALGFRV